MNRLKQLRNEFGYTVRTVEALTTLNNTSVSFYENETRNMNVTILSTFADLYQVTVDYLIGKSDLGLFASYKDHKYLLKEEDFNRYVSEGIIYYEEGKRYINLNKKLQLSSDVDAATLIDTFVKSKQLSNFYQGNNICKIDVPLNRYSIIERILQLDDEKFAAIRNLVNLI